jgi:hypothetical protein
MPCGSYNTFREEEILRVYLQMREAYWLQLPDENKVLPTDNR